VQVNDTLGRKHVPILLVVLPSSKLGSSSKFACPLRPFRFCNHLSRIRVNGNSVFTLFVFSGILKNSCREAGVLPSKTKVPKVGGFGILIIKIRILYGIIFNVLLY